MGLKLKYLIPSLSCGPLGHILPEACQAIARYCLARRHHPVCATLVLVAPSLVARARALAARRLRVARVVLLALPACCSSPRLARVLSKNRRKRLNK